MKGHFYNAPDTIMANQEILLATIHIRGSCLTPHRQWERKEQHPSRCKLLRNSDFGDRTKFHLLIQHGLVTLCRNNLFSECTLVRVLSMEDYFSDLLFPFFFSIDEF